MCKQKLPFVCQTKGSKQKLQPAVVDYENEMVLIHPDIWIEFKDLEFFPNHDFAYPGHNSLRNFILEAEIDFKENQDVMESQNEDKSANYWAGALKAIEMLKQKIYYY